MFKFPVIEIVDRYCIAKLKFERTGSNSEELEFYLKQVNQLDLALIQGELDQLYAVHSRIWDLEDDFKKYRIETACSLEEIGRRALLIRDIMEQRYLLKNLIAEKLKDCIREHKNYGGYFVI